MDVKNKIGWISAGAIVVANMVGTGPFTTLGFQLMEIRSTWSIISLWFFGGLISLFGAFSYAELGTRLPKSGGEYHFLSKIFHPFLGYLSGWISLTVGFAAPIALAAMAMGAYIGTYSRFSPLMVALVSIVLISLIHSFDIKQSSRFQNIFTLLKVLMIVFLIVCGFWLPAEQNSVDFSSGWMGDMTGSAYAIALVYVTYAYSGWSAAAYIVEEIDRPTVNLPRALIIGTAVVSLLYVLLQVSFLHQAPLADLQGKVEVGQVAALHMFGEGGASYVSFFIALLLISNISAMIWVGPRVTRAMADDHEIWQFLAKDNPNGIPVRSIWLQTAISVFMILTSSFEQVLLYSGFVLHLFTTLTVAGVVVLRLQEGAPDEYRSPGYPWIQILFLLISIWILFFILYDRPYESLLGLTNLVIGAVSYWWSRRFARWKEALDLKEE